MAAVGALFCDIESSFSVARTLYGDASRMTVASVSYYAHGRDSIVVLTAIPGIIADADIFILRHQPSSNGTIVELVRDGS